MGPKTRRQGRPVAMSAMDMDVLANTGSILEDVVTLEVSIITELTGTNTIPVTSVKLVCATTIVPSRSTTAPLSTSTNCGAWYQSRPASSTRPRLTQLQSSTVSVLVTTRFSAKVI